MKTDQEARQRARELLREIKGEGYEFGLSVLPRVGKIAADCGSRVLLIAGANSLGSTAAAVLASLNGAGLTLTQPQPVIGARPNAPREDVYRLESYILHQHPDCVVSVGGGSCIDAVKAAIMLAALGTESPEIDSWFGSGLVTEALRRRGKKLLPHIAVATSASSGAHLTKYANVTDPAAGQKKLIVDDAITPTYAVFDYASTVSMPARLTIDGALDAVSHSLEVFYGAAPDKYELCREICETVLTLVLRYTKLATKDPADLKAREALGLASDLGGCAIMLGGTNGAHLTSFSLVDVTSHGRACGLLNPYYTVMFARALEKQLRAVGGCYAEAGFLSGDLNKMQGRELAVAVADAMLNFMRSLGAETKLRDFPAFTEAHIDRALTAARDPQLKMKLQNMPVPLAPEQIDEYMGSVLKAAACGDLSKVKSL